MTSDVCGRDVTDWGDGVMMTSLGEKDDGQSRMGKLFLPSQYSMISSGDRYEPLARK
jgi:hypothetical protein